MTTLRARLRLTAGNDREAGSVTVFVAITMVGLLVLVGLVADGGAKLRAVQRADAIAAEAARTAGQVIDLPTAVSSSDIRVDRQAAVTAANAYLTAAGASGTVTITPNGQSLQVTVTTSAPTVFLGLIGITTLTVTGHAQVDLVHGVTGGGT